MRTLTELQRELFRDSLDRESTTFNALVKQYRRAHEIALARFDRVTAAIERRIAVGWSPVMAYQLEADRIADFLSEMTDTLIAAGDFTAEETSQLRDRLLMFGNRDAQLLLKNGTQSARFVGVLNKVSTPALKALAASFDEQSPLTALADGLVNRGASRLAKIITEGTVRGLSPRALVPNISRSLNIDSTQAMTIARTEGIRPYRVATAANYRANASLLMGWRWLSTLDFTTCAACLALHGTLHSLDEEMGNHPNCRCTQIPAVIGDNRKMETGSEWFGNQTRDSQLKILGSRKALGIYDSGTPLSAWIHETQDGQWGLTRRARTPVSNV